MTISYRIRQDGKTVAQASGKGAETSILNYAMQYRQDGEVTIQHNAQGHWKRYAYLCHWPAPEAAEGAVE